MVMAHRVAAVRRAVARHREHVEARRDPRRVDAARVANVPEGLGRSDRRLRHNVESDIWARYHANEPRRLRRAYIGLQRRKVERFERPRWPRPTP